ncbi:hypothetical protein CHL10075_08065, partial [Campylobacter hyointestinalis subsp. lawsonii]
GYLLCIYYILKLQKLNSSAIMLYFLSLFCSIFMLVFDLYSFKYKFNISAFIPLFMSFYKGIS